MDDTDSFLELFPQFTQIITIDSIIYLGTLLILALLMVQFFKRKHKFHELTMFFRMCVLNALMALCGLAADGFLSFWEIDDDIVLISYFIYSVMQELFAILLLAQWLLFVEYTLHHSRDIIRRRYAVAAAVPFLVAVVTETLSIIIAFQIDLPFDNMAVATLLYVFSHIVMIIYIVAAYIIQFMDHRRKKLPRYIRLTPTVLCILTGYILNWFVTAYPTVTVGFAFGLVFADFYMYRRLSYIDPKTGFYLKKFLPVLARIAKKKKFEGGTVIRFKAKRAGEKMASILKAWKPQNCLIITMGDGLFLIISGPLKASTSERFISLVSEEAKSEGIPLETGYETENKGPAEIYIKKLIADYSSSY